MAEHINKERKPMDVEVVVLEEENEVECIDNKHKEKDDHVHLKENGKGDLHIVKHNKDEGDIGPKECSGSGVEVKVEEKVNNDEDLASDSFEMLVDDSDNEQSSASDYDDKAKNEAPLTDAEVEELVAEFLEIESKAAEAQESLEQESLAQVEREVRSELAESLHGDALELAVSNEMKVLVEEWEDVLDNLETQSALLLEQLDGAGIELPSLYKWIESQVPGGCRTEAWKTRAHWVGSVATSELNQSVKDAEQYLQSCHPVRRKHGRLLESGSSGYLAKNLSVKDGDNLIENSEKDWQIFDEIIHSGRFSDSNSFGSNNWAAVYMASTPQQAANLGLHLPGVNEVEEIGEIEGNPFYDEATQNEKEIGLSEEQKRNYTKVREEDDVKITKKLQCRLKQRRKRKRKYQELFENGVLDGVAQLNESQLIFRDPSSSGADVDHPVAVAEDLKPEIPNKPKNEIPIQNDTIKRSCESEDVELDNKRHRTVIIESDDEVQVIDDKSPSHDLIRDQCLTAQVREVVDVIDSDVLSSPTPANNDSLMDIPEKFHCTACSEVLKASEVQRHPTLEVIVCTKCNLLIEEKMRIEDPDLGVYCRWCSKCDDLIRCKSCKMLFCAMCIARNFGETRFLDVETNGWDCCCCSPVLLHQFISECEKALKGFMVSSSESESELSDGQMVVRLGHKKRRKKRIRRIIDDTELGEETRRKIAMEKARQEHLKSMQAQSVGKFCNTRSNESVGEVSLDDAIEGYIVNIAREKDEEPVRIPQSISAKLKPHQISGIRFMWENIIQSVKKVKSGDIGLGCILAHTMGLGKTFQVIAFLYTAMRKIDLGLRTALIVTPVNVLHNWRQEFVKWRPTELKSLRVFMLEDVARERRADLLSKWRVKGGIFLIGYAAFRNLSLGRHVKDRSTASEICHALHYVPDILVCDEAHMIKNTRADITQALKQVKTQRRIALTGSPLQNNLMEYYCMVDFVREGYLGSSHEFRNRFQNPIENGQHTNSTIDDVRIMNQRSHILYEQLKGFVQRMDMNVVKKDLPPKTVFVITVKLSPLQRKLYRKFLDVHGFTGDKISSERTIRPRCFFANYQALAQVWNHPGLLQVAKEHRDYLRQEDAVENFLVEDGSSDDNMENDFSNGEKQKAKDDIFYKRNDGVFYHQETDWWTDLLGEKIYQEVDYSGKMVLLLDILTMSSEVGDKVLVFSQSLTTLDLIEMFLSKLARKESEGKFWKQGKDWYRLDGSTQSSERQKLVERFNEPTNKRVKCTLISTRAGSLGINLYAANRVIVVDGSWNPTYDLQAIYRVWRYGQTKPVYAYRLMAHGTMEEKIYKRQVTKEGLAARVVDRQQIHRTMSKEEILHLFDFGDDENADMLEQDHRNPMTSSHDETNEVGCLGNHECLPFNTADKLMENLLRRHYPRWIANYHEHETLLQENEAERLSKEEQDMAWQTYRRSLEWEEVHRTTLDDGDRVANSNTPPEIIVSQQTKGSSRSRPVKQRKCTNLAHLLTLRSQGIKPGFSTVCGECSQEISWENLNRDGRSR